MTGYIEPPPPPQPRGMGCFGKGCLILSLLILFLLIMGAVGIYSAFRTHSAVVHGVVWAQQNHLLATEPSPVPQFETTPEHIKVSERKWHDFESASRNDESAHVELTADDLNNLIAQNRHIRGKVFTSIESNRLHVQTSVPIGELIGRNGYYLNGDIVVQTDGPRSLDNAPLNSVTINGQPLPRDLPGWKFKSRPVSDYFAEFRGDVDANTFEIRDGKIILDKGRR
ncbi:MAG: hypothetical protein DLM52_11965 [Chthoniobacterales bacterium]|nr:MAG: hypothetical protein DLM52_11965 [Chthoniobacterales bacterium]